MREILILQRLASSPYTRPWLWQEDAVLALRARIGDGGREEAYTIATNAGQPLVRFGLPPRADVEVSCTAEDLEAMLAGHVPPGEVVLTLGSREVPAWRAQARGVLLLAALGWAGMWPDPDAEEDHEVLVRSALLDLTLGRADARVRLFANGGPPELAHVEVRVRDGARGRELNTEGLSLATPLPRPRPARPSFPPEGPRPPPRPSFPPEGVGQPLPPGRLAELGTVLVRGETLSTGLRRLRAGALWELEHRGFPHVLELGPPEGSTFRLGVTPHPSFPSGMPLPRGRVWLLELREIAGGAGA